MAPERKEALAAPPSSLQSPPFVPIIDDTDSPKMRIGHWSEIRELAPITAEPPTPHLSIEQVIAPRPYKKTTETFSKEGKPCLCEKKDQRVAMAEEECLGMELKRKLSHESLNAQVREAKIGGQRFCTSLSPPVSDTSDALCSRELEVRVGEGRYGRVFKRDGQAIKVALNNLEARKSLEREAWILGSLSHPNIVEFYAFGGHKLYMELADNTLVHKDACFDVRAVARELFAALTYMHGKGIIHGDLKPANLLQKDGNLLLCDFGQSRYDYETHSSVGTTAYAAPECLQLLPAQTFKSDVYSAGACLYYLMAGRDPFQQHAIRNSVQMIIRIRAGFFGADNVQVDHDNPLRHNDALLVEVVKRCTKREACQRPDAREVLSLLSTASK